MPRNSQPPCVHRHKQPPQSVHPAILQSISASQPQPNHFQSVSSHLSCSLPICSRPVSIDTSSRHRQTVHLATLQSVSAQPAKFSQIISPSLLAASFTYSQCQLFSVSQPPCSQQLPIQSEISSQSSPLTASHSRSTLDVNARSLMHFTLYARTSAPPPLAAAPAARSPRSPLATLRSRLYGARLGRRADSARESGPTSPLRRAGAVSET